MTYEIYFSFLLNPNVADFGKVVGAVRNYKETADKLFPQSTN